MYARRKAYSSKRKKPSFAKGRKVAYKRTKYARAKPYNDDPQTPFCKYPLSTNRNEFYCKITGQSTVANGLGTTYATSFFINFPGYYVANNSSIGLLPFTASNFDNLIAVFDEWCVVGMNVKWLTDSNVATVPNGVAGYKVVFYSNRDLSDSSLIASEDQAMNGAGTIVHSQLYNHNRYTKPQNPNWLPTTIVPASGTVSFNQATQSFQPAIQESIKYYFPGIVTGDNAGYFNVSWYIRFRGLSPITT